MITCKGDGNYFVDILLIIALFKFCPFSEKLSFKIVGIRCQSRVMDRRTPTYCQVFRTFTQTYLRMRRVFFCNAIFSKRDKHDTKRLQDKRIFQMIHVPKRSWRRNLDYGAERFSHWVVKSWESSRKLFTELERNILLIPFALLCILVEKASLFLIINYYVCVVKCRICHYTICLSVCVFVCTCAKHILSPSNLSIGKTFSLIKSASSLA